MKVFSALITSILFLSSFPTAANLNNDSWPKKKQVCVDIEDRITSTVAKEDCIEKARCSAQYGKAPNQMRVVAWTIIARIEDENYEKKVKAFGNVMVKDSLKSTASVAEIRLNEEFALRKCENLASDLEFRHGCEFKN